MMRQRRTVAFSIMELLVVMAIISLMLGILIPVLGAARRAVWDSRCLGNLHNIGNAMMIYISTYEDHIPPAGPGTDATDGSYPYWYYTLLPFGNTWEIYECPAKATTLRDVPELDEHGDPIEDGEYHTVNYGMNFRFPGVGPANDLLGGTIQTTMLTSVADVMIIADGALFSGGTSLSELTEDKELPDSVKWGCLFFADPVVDEQPTVSPRHRGNTMCLFLDGSVKRVLTRDILAADRDQPDCFYDGHMLKFD